MTIGVNLKAIVKNYSLCEKLFREDYKDNNYTKGILDFFSNIEINSDIIHDLKRLKKEGNKIDLYVPNYLVYGNEKIMEKVKRLLEFDEFSFDTIKKYNSLDELKNDNIDCFVSDFNIGGQGIILPYGVIKLDSCDYEKFELVKKVYNAKYDINLRKINELEYNTQKARTGIPSIDKPWRKFYSEKEKSVVMPRKTMYEYLKCGAEKMSNKTALVYYGRKFTYEELMEKIDKYASSFISYGIKEGDVVSICMPNAPEAIFMVYALNKIGAIANMIHPLKSPNEIKEYVNKVDSKMLLVLDTTLQNIEGITNELCTNKIVSVSVGNSMPLYMKLIFEKSKKLNLTKEYISLKDFENNGKKVKNSLQVDYKENAGAAIMHTGGTSGKSKAVLLTNDNLNSMVHAQRVTAKNFAEGDVMLTIMPVFHGFGLCSSVHMPLSYGVSVVLWPKFESKKLKSMYEKNNVNHMFGIPKLFECLIKENVDLTNAGYLVSGGEKIEQKREQKINNGFLENGSKFNLKKGYGLTEATAGTTLSDDYSNRLGSIGIPLVCNDFKVVKPGTEEELGYYEKGEFCISGPTVMKCYYNDEEETKKTLRKHSDGKIWLHTGDMGYMDESGLLYYTDRLTRMYTSGGFNVYPPHIEEVILKLDEIESCAVVPMKHPSKNIKVPKVYIIMKKGYEFNEDLLNKIKNICSLNLDLYHQPFSIESIDSFPITNLGENIGKVDYKKLEENANETVKVKKLVK